MTDERVGLRAEVPPGARRWTARTVARRAIDVLREESLRSLWFRALGETIYRRLALIELDLRNPPAVVDAVVPLECGFLSSAEAAEYAVFRPDTPVGEVQARLRRGDRCFVARHEGRLVSARWIATGEARFDYLDRTLMLREDEIFAYESYTRPEHRGGSVSSAAGTRLAQLLSAEGFTRIVAGANPDTRTARRMVAKAGYRRIGTIGYVRLGPWRREFRRAMSPR